MGASEPPVDPAARDKYRLHVTAGPSRDPSTHQTVTVNGSEPLKIESDLMTVYLNVRIKDYNGFPSSSPPTCDYFSHPMHTSDRYSISYAFVPKIDIPGQDLVFGFDFDHSIKDRLPPGFKSAMRIVTTLLDPGLYADPYSDKPYLYGPALSSFFTFHIGETIPEAPVSEQLITLSQDATQPPNPIIIEGSSGSGTSLRTTAHSIPSKSSKRRKHFLTASNLHSFTFERDRLYASDFFNPYLDFANFALALPGLKIPVAKYIDDKTHELRFVVLDRGDEKGEGGEQVGLVVGFKLVFGEELEGMVAREEGERKERDLGEEEVHERPDDVMEGEKEVDESRRRDRNTSSTSLRPADAATASLESRSGIPPKSDIDHDTDVQNSGPEDDQSTATMLANTISSALAALGFGSMTSTPSSENNSRETSQERTVPDNVKREGSEATPTKAWEERVDQMSVAQVEEFLKDRHSNS